MHDRQERDTCHIWRQPGQMVKELLEAVRPEEEIDKNALIGIKPNLVEAKPSSSGATTAPEIVEGSLNT